MLLGIQVVFRSGDYAKVILPLKGYLMNKHLLIFGTVMALGLLNPAQAAPAPTYIQLEGPVQAMVAQHIGTWKIGGLSFVVNAQTQVEQGDCPLKAGGHAEVKAYAQGNQWIATEIECERTPKPQVKVELKGILTTKAAPGGVWKIGNTPFKVNAQTRLDQKDCPLQVNGYAEMDGYYQGKQWVATKVECERQP